MKTLKIMMLYPEEMNIYGDHGNLESLTHRAELYGYKVEQILYEPGMKFDETADIILGGGGQDSGQGKIIDDLQKIASKLKKMAKNGTPMLMICGMYQLFGNYFETVEGKKLNGIGIFDLYTIGGKTRNVGNIVEQSTEFGEIIGYENHSGLTYLNESQKPLAGKIIRGFGNCGKGDEGARINNVLGSYLHGPILPKNPTIADFLIKTAAKKKYSKFEPTQKINDSLVEKAREIAKTRPQ